MSIFLPTENRRGMALLNMVFIFIFIGVLAVSGVKMYGSMVARGKINDSKGGLEQKVQMITAWAVQNQYLPRISPDEFTTVFGSAPQDAWGNNLIYLYDNNLTNISTGGLCGRTTAPSSCTSTPLTVPCYSGVPVAFVVMSRGSDLKMDSTLNSSQALPNEDLTNSPKLSALDLFRVVTLEELKSKAGCYGPTGGRLTIVNNELPNVCAGASYNATLFGVGGVPDYTWSVANPHWLSAGATTGITRNLTNAGFITSTASDLTFTLKDASDYSVSRILPIKVGYTGACANSLINCAAGPNCYAACFADPPCFAACIANPACVAACASNPACKDACAANPTCASACPACTTVPAITFTNPPTDTVANNWNGGEVTDTGYHSQGSKIDFTLDYTNGTMSAISNANGTSTNCIWYQNPLTLYDSSATPAVKKKLRAYFSFQIELEQGFAFILMPAQGRDVAEHSCGTNANQDGLGFGSGIPGYGSTLLGVLFPGSNHSTCISTDGSQCVGANNSWSNNGATYHVRLELDASNGPPYTFKEWLCPVGNGSCTAANITSMQDLTTPFTGFGSYATATIPQAGVEAALGLSKFFIGFSTSQHGNDQVHLVLSGLKFGLY